MRERVKSTIRILWGHVNLQGNAVTHIVRDKDTLKSTASYLNYYFSLFLLFRPRHMTGSQSRIYLAYNVLHHLQSTSWSKTITNCSQSRIYLHQLYEAHVCQLKSQSQASWKALPSPRRSSRDGTGTSNVTRIIQDLPTRSIWGPERMPGSNSSRTKRSSDITLTLGWWSCSPSPGRPVPPKTDQHRSHLLHKIGAQCEHK